MMDPTNVLSCGGFSTLAFTMIFMKCGVMKSSF